MERLASILIGAVIAAAFLGPGTVTTAARAGAGHGVGLLWALVFATLACFILQEASARLTIVSGRPLGRALRERYAGPGGYVVLVLVLGAVVLGCAAYQAGNILGGVAGAQLASGYGPVPLTLISAGAAFLLLWLGNTRVVVSVLGALVAIMGFAFVITAWRVGAELQPLVAGLLVPSVPQGGAILVLGLIGTTVVPYNLFLGSGLAHGQPLDAARLGLAVAIGLGGLVSMAVVVVGSALSGEFSFQALAAVLGSQSGDWAGRLFGWGLFAAGFSSAVTAPLAAAMTARGLFAQDEQDPQWQAGSLRFRAVWIFVLLVGTGFGLADVKPVPMIILAQALNGFLLPVVGVFLFVVVNDSTLMRGRENGVAANLAMAVVVAICTALGARGALGATAAVFDRPAWTEPAVVAGVSAVALVGLGLWTWRQLGNRSRRRVS